MRPVTAIDVSGNAVFDRFSDTAFDLASDAPGDVLFVAAGTDRNVAPFIQSLSQFSGDVMAFIPIDIAGAVACDRYLVAAVFNVECPPRFDLRSDTGIEVAGFF